MSPLKRAHPRSHGLDRPPFDAVPEADFLYGDPAVDMPVTLLLKRLRNDDKLLVLTGEFGVGKSTQLRRLLLQGAKFGTFCAFRARPETPFAAIERTLRQHWGTAAAATPIEEWLGALCREGHSPMVVIDDAHHLTPAALGELLRLRQTVRRQCPRGLGLLLAGAPDLVQRLATNADADRALEPVVEVVLRAFTWEQTEAYLRHRLLAAGAREPDQLSGAIAHAIHQQSGGLPSAINIAANRHLQGPDAPTRSEGGLAKEPPSDPGLPRSTDPSPSHAPPRSDPRSAPENARKPAATPPSAPPQNGGHGTSGQPGRTEREASGIARLLQDPGALRLVLVGVVMGLVLLVLVTVFAPPDDNGPQPLGLPEPGVISEPAPAAPSRPSAGAPTPAPSPARLPIPLSAEPRPIEPRPIEPRPAETRPVETRPVETRPVETRPAEPRPVETRPVETRPVETTPSETAHRSGAPYEPGLQPGSAAQSNPEPFSGLDSKSEPDPEPTAQSSAGPAPRQAGLPSGPQDRTTVAGPRPVQEIAWIRRQDPGHWSLQIAAGGDRTALQAQGRRLVQDPAFAPGAEVAWFQTRRNGRDWYTLILGPYPTAQAAQAAAATLPAPLQQRQPWARRFDAIHQLLGPAR